MSLDSNCREVFGKLESRSLADSQSRIAGEITECCSFADLCFMELLPNDVSMMDGRSEIVPCLFHVIEARSFSNHAHVVLDRFA